jgi:hypothetical protein
MSTQSLNKLSAGRYYKDFENKLKIISDTHFYKKHFLIDCDKTDVCEARQALLMYSFLDTQNCEVLNHIQDTIDGKEIKRKVKVQKITDRVDESNVIIIEHPMIWEDAAW